MIAQFAHAVAEIVTEIRLHFSKEPRLVGICRHTLTHRWCNSLQNTEPTLKLCSFPKAMSVSLFESCMVTNRILSLQADLVSFTAFFLPGPSLSKSLTPELGSEGKSISLWHFVPEVYKGLLENDPVFIFLANNLCRKKRENVHARLKFSQHNAKLLNCLCMVIETTWCVRVRFEKFIQNDNLTSSCVPDTTETRKTIQPQGIEHN